ncbi:MAG: hypothetical protein J0626_11785, partial [Rhodospirillaceae bacterium]|nr:hypothetical protein [Rhodospirillaceae bacterium]
MQTEGNVLAYIKMREQGVILKQIGKLTPLWRQVDALRGGVQALPTQFDTALIGCQQSSQRF